MRIIKTGIETPRAIYICKVEARGIKNRKPVQKSINRVVFCEFREEQGIGRILRRLNFEPHTIEIKAISTFGEAI